MKYSLNWIKKFVDLPDTYQISELKEALWESLAEIESVEEPGKLYDGVVIALIKEVEKHPKSDHLLITKIDVGSNKDLTVVTGAPNVEKGQFVPYLPVGSTVPRTKIEGEPVVLAEKVMLGIPSQGMLASQFELNLGEDHSGIMVINPEQLENPVVPGQNFAQALGLQDALIEIENKSMTHRGDCFSVVGIAREVAAITNSKFIEPEWLEPKPEQLNAYAVEFDPKFTNTIAIDMQASDLVPRYSAILLDNVTIGESPLWLQVLLMKHGIKPINNVVDITNYIMIEWGQPLHAFDAAMVEHSTNNGNTTYNVVVRRSKAGEKIFALDNKEHVLDGNTVVIADPKHLLGIAGIIGGSESAISGNTTRIILEAATFDMYAIRKSTMNYGLFTDASTVFSRKQDPEKTVKAMLRAIDFLQKYAGAEIASTVADVKNYEEKEREMIVSPEKARQFIGVEISDEEMIEILKRLNYKVSKKGSDLVLEVPSYRMDILIDEDIYEEIIRIHRYSTVIPELPRREIYGVKLSRQEKLIKRIRTALTAQGMYETLNFSFVSEALYNKCLIDTKDCFKVINAVSPDVQFVRKLVAPGLLQQAVNNQYNDSRFGIFEFGLTARKGYMYGKTHADLAYSSPAPFGKDDYNLPIEDKHFAAAVVSETKDPVYFELKKYIHTMLSGIVRGTIEYRHFSELPKKLQTKLPMWLTDFMKMTKGGRTAVITVNYDDETMLLGVMGEVNLMCRRNLGLQKEAAVAEMNLQQVQDLYLGEQKHREPSIYPVIQVDYCFEVAMDTKYEDLITTVQKAGDLELREDESLVKGISMVDIYSKNKKTKQITIRVTYQSSVKTLKDSDVKSVESAIVKAVQTGLKAKLV